MDGGLIMLKLYLRSQSGKEARLELPSPPEELNARISAIRERLQLNEALSVCTVNSPVPSLGWHLSFLRLDSGDTPQKLNRLAEAVSGMNASGRYLLCKALSTDCKQSLDDVLRTAEGIKPGGMDRYEIIPDITTHRALGQWLVEHDRLDASVPKALRSYLNYRAIGVDYCAAHDGLFLADGYAGIRAGPEQAREKTLRLTLAHAESTFTLDLPASEEQLDSAKAALEDLSRAAVQSVEFFAPYLRDLIPTDHVTVEEAQALADCLQGMAEEEDALLTYCSALAVEEPATFAEALNIAMNLCEYERVPEDLAEYAELNLRLAGAGDEILGMLAGFTDFRKLGEAIAKQEGVRQTIYGSVCRLDTPFPAEDIGQTMY